MKQERNWAVYLLECSDKTFYCGITTDLKKRVNTHNSGKGAKYTRGRRPVRLIGFRTGLAHSEALKLEIQIKKLPKNQKLELFDKDVKK